MGGIIPFLNGLIVVLCGFIWFVVSSWLVSSVSVSSWCLFGFIVVCVVPYGVWLSLWCLFKNKNGSTISFLMALKT